MMRTTISRAILLGALFAAISHVGAAPRDASLKMESRAAVHRALRQLAATQEEQGSWRDDPAITALVATAMMSSGLPEFGPASPPVSAALDYIRKHAREDGSIYDRFYPNYTTSVVAMALVEAGLPQDRALIEGARRFLFGLQADESDGITRDDPDYGGWGYQPGDEADAARRADLSNTQLAIEALHAIAQAVEEDRPETEVAGAATRTELAWEKAVIYLERCQNDDGGFIYRPGHSYAGVREDGGLRSYGGMTYAGLKSMIYAQVDRSDRRVQAAFAWISRNWSVAENPGLDEQGLYYHYQTMAKALRAYGEEEIVTPEGERHDWRRELVAQLLKVQREDGTWQNENSRWMERIPELVTAYSVLAISHATQEW